MVQRSTTWLQRRKDVINGNRTCVLCCAAFLICCGTLQYVVVRYDTLWYAMLRGGRRHNEAQRGDIDAPGWRQRCYRVAATRHFPTLTFTAGRQRDDSVDSTCRQCVDNVAQHGTQPKCENVFPERDDQKLGTTPRSKRNTLTGA